MAFAYTLFAISSLGEATVSSREIRVDPSKSIQEAINNANHGDTIIVSQGTYKQWHIIVNKTLTIVGEGLENTIIDGNGIADVIFQIVADNVVIENFTLQNASTDPYTQGTAIRISNSINVQVNKIIAEKNFCSIELLSSNFTKVTSCKISNSTAFGIHIHAKSVNNTFVGNTVANNSIGVYIADPESRHNIFYHNNFVNNTNQVSIMSISHFDDGYPSGGNYWSDHIETDLKHGVYQNESGSDGIVDEKYYGRGAIDNYPFAHPITIFEVVVDEERFEVEASTNSSLNGYTFNSDAKSLKLLLGGDRNTNGSCRISIPRGLLWCTSPSEWKILSSNNGLLGYLTFEDAQRTYLYFTYNHSGGLEIEIIGSNAIPEFPNDAILLTCIFSIFIFIIILFKRKLAGLQSSGVDGKF